MEDMSSDQHSPLTWRLRALTLVGVIGLPAFALGVAALALPSQTTEQETVQYEHTGEFSYSADAPDDSLYGPGGLTSGEPIAVDVAGPVTLGFDYLLKTAAATDVAGSVTMQAVVELPEGLTRTFSLTDKETFTGGELSTSARLPVDRINDFVTDAQESLGGSFGSNATVIVRPVINVEGTLSAQPLEASFEPELRFVLSQGVLTVDNASPDPTPAPDAPEFDPFAQASEGEVEYEVQATRTMSLIVAGPTVTEVRTAGLLIAGACLLLGLLFALPLIRRGNGTNEAARIQLMYGSRIVPVRAIAIGEGPVAEVSSMEALADLAKRYESVIMHVADGDDAFLVWDNGMTFRYRPRDATPTSPGFDSDRALEPVSDRDWDLLSRMSESGERSAPE